MRAKPNCNCLDCKAIRKIERSQQTHDKMHEMFAAYMAMEEAATVDYRSKRMN